MNEKLKEFTTSEILQELLTRGGSELQGFGCMFHVIREHFCKYTYDDGTEETIKTTFVFHDGSKLSSEHPRKCYAGTATDPYQKTCYQIRSSKVAEIYTARKFI